MVKQVVNVGANANDGTGDDLRTAMQKINTNFTELFGTTAEANDLVEDGTPQLGGNLDIQNYIITTNTTNGAISIQPNGSGAVLLKNIRITDNVISSDDSTNITINDSLIVTGSISTPTLYTNMIQNEDSSIVKINDGLQVVGVMKSTSVITNSLSSDDSSAIEIAEDLLVSGTVSTESVRTNSLYSEAIQIVDNNISARRSNDNLVLSGSSSGSVKIEMVKFPKTDGTNGQVLQTNGAGQLDWATAGAGSGVIFSADDSTSTAAPSGTLQVKGSSNISTNISGDILTITGPNLSSYLTAVPKTIDVNEISSSDSSAIQINDGLNVSGTLTANTFVTNDISSSESTAIQINDSVNVLGTLTANTFVITNFVTNNISSSESTAIQVDDAMSVQGTLTANTFVTNNISSSESSAIQINDSINISGDATIAGTINGSLAFSNLTSKPTTVSGYGITDAVSTSTTAITVVGDDSTGTNFTLGETLKVTGSSGIAAAVSGDTLTISLVAPGSVGTIGDLIVSGQTITGGTNGDITLVPQGVGNINLDADRIRVGDLNSDVTISSNGAADLILKTDVDNPSISSMGSITIGDGVDGVTTITTSENGYVSVGNTTWTTLSASGSRNEHGLAVTMDIDRNLSAFDLERYHASSIGARFNIQGTDPDNANTVPYRAQQIELYSNLLAKTLISKNWITFDPSSRNAGITSIDSGGQVRGYAGGPVALGIQNVFRNNTAGDAQVEETASISSFTSINNTAAQHTITINNLHGIQQAFDLAASGGDAVVDNIRTYVATGNYFTSGSATANNYYAFWAGQVSEATNNWGIYIESADWENYLGGLTIVDNTIRADRTNDSIYLETSGSGKVIVNDSLQVINTLTANTIITNDISSADSSAIQINDGVNISGTLNAATIVNNTISTNEIASADSSAIQINDGVNISGTLNAKTIVTNDLISQDSSVINVLDGLNVSGALTTTSINSSSTVSAEHLTLTGLSTLGNKTVAQLSSLTPSIGTMVYCTDETGGAQPIFYDGTNWRRMTDRIVVS